MTPEAAERHRIANRKWANKRNRELGRKERPPKQLRLIAPPRKPRAKLPPEERRRRQKERYQRLRVELIEYQKHWREANPEKYRRSHQLGGRQREARKRATESGPVSYHRILERDGPFCGICNGFLDPSNLKGIQFDHIIPLAKGGAHVESNIQVAHPLCNMRKQASLSP